MNDLLHPAARDPFSTRYSLLSRLQDWDDQESWKDFFETYWRLIHSAAMRAGLTEDEAQEVVQETVISVAKSIHKFKRDRRIGSFKSWLRNIVRWRIADQFKKRGPAGLEENGHDPQLIPDDADALEEAAWQEAWRANLLEAAMERVKQRVKEEHFQMFHLYVIKRRPVAEIANVLNVSAGRVYVIKHRISAMIKKEVKRMEKTPV